MGGMRRVASVGLGLVLWALAFAGEAPDEPRKLKTDPTQEYFVYFPKNFDAKRTYYAFVAVHDQGGTGQGASGWGIFTPAAIIPCAQTKPRGPERPPAKTGRRKHKSDGRFRAQGAAANGTVAGLLLPGH